jgi:RND family efflux transporter MFP subunit
MTVLKDDLAALRIERQPDRSGVARAVGWVLVLVLLAAVAGGGWVWATRERPLEVEVATVAERPRGAQAEVLNASGYVTARRRATVSSKITGKVVEVNVEEGMAVKEGQVLARLDDANMRAALALAQAQAEAARRNITENEVRLADARVTLGRRMQLVKERVVAQSEVDQAQADVDSIAARIGAAREMVSVAERQVGIQQTELDNTIIRAPFTGIAVTKDAQPGEMVSPVSAGGGFTRTGICTIVDMKSLEIDVDVNEAYINRVVSGQDVRAVLNAYPDWQIPARVITTVPTADRQKATVQVRIGFVKLDPRILPDMGVKVTFLRPDAKPLAKTSKTSTTSKTSEPDEAFQRPVTLVPKTAIRNDRGQTVLFVMRGDGHVERRAVRTGGEDGAQIEVVAGVARGEQVVAPLPALIKDGVPVTIKR